MTDPLAQRLATLLSTLRDPSKPEPERLAGALAALAGLDSKEVTAADWKRILRHLARVNEVLRRYPIQTAADYALISPHDLTQIRAQLTSVSSRLRPPGPNTDETPGALRRRARP